MPDARKNVVFQNDLGDKDSLHCPRRISVTATISYRFSNAENPLSPDKTGEIFLIQGDGPRFAVLIVADWGGGCNRWGISGRQHVGQRGALDAQTVARGNRKSRTGFSARRFGNGGQGCPPSVRNHTLQIDDQMVSVVA